MRALDDHAARRLAEDVAQARWSAPPRTRPAPRTACRPRPARAGRRRRRAPRARPPRPRAAASPAARGSPSRSRRRSADRTAVDPARRESGPSPGIQPSAEWTVLARTPLASRHPDRRPPGGCDKQHAHATAGGERGDRPDRRGLAGPGPAGDHRQPVCERVPNARELLGGGLLALGACRPPRAAAPRRSLGAARTSSTIRSASSASSSAVSLR